MVRKKSGGITPKQKALLEFIAQFTHEKGYAPSQQEIANHFGWRSLGTVQDYFKILTTKGVLERRANHPRTLEVKTKLLRWTSSDEVVRNIPISGKIAAGNPIEAIEESKAATLPIPVSMLPSGEFYALEVNGKSMTGEGIFPGDYIIVKVQEQAEDGDTVVALLGNEATVKKIYRQQGEIELRPANEQMESRWIDEDGCKVRGVVVALYRRYWYRK